ncbi:MAG: APC family permease [Alphaproteobacteria bacterium]|nr:APC family permease [Alphaproteobacteria bacterium]
MTHQPYKLNTFNLTIIVISLVIGMGIFKTPAIAAAKSGSSTIFFLAWILGGIISICGAFTYIEIGQRLPAIGGFYKIFTSSGYHPAIGFTINILILISNAASLAIVAIIGSEYFSDIFAQFGFPLSSLESTFLAVLFILIFYFINLMGLKSSTGIQDFLMLFKIVLILTIILAIFKKPYTGNIVYDTATSSFTLQDYPAWLLLIFTLTPVAFVYGGYQQTMNFTGEVKNITTLKKSIIFGILTIIILYLGVNIAYVQNIGFDKMKNAEVIGSIVFNSFWGSIGRIVFDCCMVFGVLAYVNVILLSNPRVLYAMSKDGLLPKFFAKYNESKGIFANSLTVFSILTMGIIFYGKKVDDLLSFSIFIDCLGMILSANIIFKIAKQTHLKKISFLSKLLALVFMLSYFIVFVGICISKYGSALIATSLILVFLGLYFILKKNNVILQNNLNN